MPKFCSECGTAVGEGHRFCPRCGHDLGGEGTVACPSCGAVNPPAAGLCFNCGTKLHVKPADAGQIKRPGIFDSKAVRAIAVVLILILAVAFLQGTDGDGSGDVAAPTLKVDTVDLKVTWAGCCGTITRAPAGTTTPPDDCADTGGCTYTFETETTVTLTAEPNDDGSTFVGWSGACTGTGRCVVAMDGDKFVTAMFTRMEAPTTPRPIKYILTFLIINTGKPDPDRVVETVTKKFTAMNDNNWLNENLVFPVGLLVELRECGEVNAFYKQHRVTMCYDLTRYIASKFKPYADSPAELRDAAAQATLFIYYHEMGHALIDVFDLPVTGREEDAVDQLATVTAMESGQDEAAYYSATWFYLVGRDKANVEELPYWDEHALELQRYYNIICWIYGKDPARYANMAKESGLPEDRARRCPAEYEQMRSSWDRLLAPHRRAPA